MPEDPSGDTDASADQAFRPSGGGRWHRPGSTPGSVFGFLGPNGSGKTTTIRMLLGLAFASSGDIELLGQPMPLMSGSVLRNVGALVEGPAFYPWLSGRANLERFDSAGPHGPQSSAGTRRARVSSALEKVGLTAAAGQRYRRYSLGMRQRLALAGALVRPCQLLVLDEPTNGLDPQAMREVRLLVRRLAAEGTTVFLSSHLLSEVEQVCSHVAVMRSGRMVAQGPIDDLRALGRPHLVLETPDAGAALSVIGSLGGLGEPVVDSTGRIRAELNGALIEEVNAALVGAGVRVRGISGEGASLEEAFVELVGEGFGAQ